MSVHTKTQKAAIYGGLLLSKRIDIYFFIKYNHI